MKFQKSNLDAQDRILSLWFCQVKELKITSIYQHYYTKKKNILTPEKEYNHSIKNSFSQNRRLHVLTQKICIEGSLYAMLLLVVRKYCGEEADVLMEIP